VVLGRAGVLLNINLGSFEMSSTSVSSSTTPSVRLRRRLRWVLRPDPGRFGYAVRIDWPGGAARPVVHDFVRFTTSLPRALGRAAATDRFWQRGPIRPLVVTVAPMSWSLFAAHRSGCTSLCPAAALLLATPGGAEAWLGQQG
jgi:hypothetical protein